MPHLSFNDVFLSDKMAVVERIQQTEEAIKAYGVFIVYHMLKEGVKEVVIARKDFMKLLDGAEATAISLKGNPDYVTFRLQDDDPNS